VLSAVGAAAGGACVAAQADSVPLKRGPQPDDIATAVLYLAQATSVTGVTIPVDGGQHLAWRTADSEAVE